MADVSLLEEWQLLAESPFPGWQVVEELARSVSTESEGTRLLVFEPAGNEAYRIGYSIEAPFEWAGEPEARIRKTLRGDGFVGLTVRGPEVLSRGLRLFQRVQKREVKGAELASELGGRLLGLEALLETNPLLMLAGHDGDPIFLLTGVKTI
ncbi:hypothetical protein HPC49_35295 [Pyxidicoccus fallax]|uniref:Uncharacterized protein n=1 Tax=Pyxidicoccus fallax TaxID=394095 RepID=A0A848LQ72_9BACT|nr:hypothetical protein [Pyxidicoccus fallax]NMO19723.1 hypothetical protein [Pyxidicoccus fallax]NPC83477.1 hypothetical protein [Pyxidicoccus fallax]